MLPLLLNRSKQQELMEHFGLLSSTMSIMMQDFMPTVSPDFKEKMHNLKSKSEMKKFIKENEHLLHDTKIDSEFVGGKCVEIKEMIFALNSVLQEDDEFEEVNEAAKKIVNRCDKDESISLCAIGNVMYKIMSFTAQESVSKTGFINPIELMEHLPCIQILTGLIQRYETNQKLSTIGELNG